MLVNLTWHGSIYRSRKEKLQARNSVSYECILSNKGFVCVQETYVFVHVCKRKGYRMTPSQCDCMR